MAETKDTSRREFLKVSAAGAATLAIGAKAVQAASEGPAIIKKREPSDTINVGYIGVGVRGKQHMRFTGFPHPNDKEVEKTQTKNLPRPLNIRAMAVCDLYEGNRKWAGEAAGKDAKVYLHHEDLLNDKNIDAVFIGTSDHNHAPIGMLAAQAGKGIYSEKCFANSIPLVKAYRDAVKKYNAVFQLGHQVRSGSIMNNAKKALGTVGETGALGKVTLIETYTNRNSPNAAWVYKIPADASEKNIMWDRFIGASPKRPFDADRFFRWRKYWDYGTGLSGDLLSHEMDAVQQVTGLGIPDTCVATGGIFRWKDGRETPDTFQVSFKYDKEELLLLYTATLSNGFRRETRYYGKDATMDLSEGYPKIVIDADTERESYLGMIDKKQWIVPVGNEKDAAAREKIRAETSDTSKWTVSKGIYIDIVDGKEINVTALHTLNFIECVRAGNRVTNCHVDIAFQEGVIANMANLAYQRGARQRWNPKTEDVVNDA